MDIVLVGGPQDGHSVAALPEGYVIIRSDDQRSVARYAPFMARIERTGGDAIMQELIDAHAHFEAILKERRLRLGDNMRVNADDAELTSAAARVREASRRQTAWLDQVLRE